MYNLIVTGREGAWDGSQYELEVNRVGEHTDDAIAERYKVLNDAAISELLSFPALFAYEQGHNADARVGFLVRIRSRSGQVRFDYEFYPDLPAIPASELTKLAWELDINKWEMNRTHWAVKAVDLLPVLADARLITKEQLARLPRNLVKSAAPGMSSQLVVTPAVFSIPNQRPEPDLVSVMMPLEAAFTQVYSAIQRACADSGLRCLRADSIWQESTVIQDVFNLLVRSHIVVVDFSGRNSNVMYETGIAHTLGRPVIPISQSLDDVPFDLRHHRVLKYLPNAEGLTSMQATLAERLQTLNRRTTASS